jgi:hypothetical protein
VDVLNADTFFRYLWRFNAVAIGVLALAGIVALSSGAVIWALDPPPPDNNAVPIASGHGYAFRLEPKAIPLNGTNEQLFVLQRLNTSEPEGATANLLVVNTDDASNHWMFPDNGQTILSRDELHTMDPSGDFSQVIGVVVEVTTDSKADRESLYYYRVGGGPAVKFLTARNILSMQQVAPDRYLVLYRNENRPVAALFSTLDFKSLSERPLPDVLE